MLRDGGLRNAELRLDRRGHRPGCLFSSGQKLKDAPPHRVA
jgi:hypothetical protein